MDAYTSGLQAPTDAVERAIGRVEDALAELDAALPDGYSITDRLISRGHTRRVRSLDETVTVVGDRFRAADATGAVVTTDEGVLGLPPPTTYGTDLRGRLARDFLDIEGSTPEEVALWWAGLSDDDRDDVVAVEYEVLGNLDGLPPEVRYEANHLRITAEIERSQDEVDQLQDDIDGRSRWDRFEDWVGDVNPGAESDTERLEWLQRRLENLERMVEDGRQIWLFDPSGDGRAAEVFGDLAEADTVSLLVPGMTNDIANFDGVAASARRVQAEADRIDPAQTHATIAWLGYDTPDDLPGAMADGAADDGGPLLVDAVEEVVRTNPDARHSVLAHSYGSVVTGRAMGADLPIDAIAVVGSPGMGPDDRDDLGSADVDLYAGEHSGDAVPYAPVHGEDPSDDGFGATRFETDVSGHSAYYDEGSLSLENLARIAAGLPLRTG